MSVDLQGALSEADWTNMCQEQTPAEVRIDRGGRRAWGYKRIRGKVLMNFARRNKKRVTIQAPYIHLDPTNEDTDASVHEEMNMVSFRNGGVSDDDEWDDDESVPQHHKRKIAKPIMDRLKEISLGRRGACLQVFDLLSYIDQHKINFRLFNPRGGKAGVNLVFQITNAPITHPVLDALDKAPFVKEVILRLNQGKVLTIKINIK